MNDPYTRSVPRFWLDEIKPTDKEVAMFRQDKKKGIRTYRQRVEKECADRITKSDARHLLENACKK